MHTGVLNWDYNRARAFLKGLAKQTPQLRIEAVMLGSVCDALVGRLNGQIRNAFT
jgi:hypothetical protein